MMFGSHSKNVQARHDTTVGLSALIFGLLGVQKIVSSLGRVPSIAESHRSEVARGIYPGASMVEYYLRRVCVCY